MKVSQLLNTSGLKPFLVKRSCNGGNNLLKCEVYAKTCSVMIVTKGIKILRIFVQAVNLLTYFGRARFESVPGHRLP